jgi:HTH-type transcriptional regulator/antitoxin HigA
LPRTMAEYGIRFIVLEHLPGTKIDGAAFWLDDSSPVITVSARVDRLDNFWFTVMHEFAHIRNGDALSVDSDLLGDEASKAPVLIENEIERRANEQAAASLIPPREIESFISRVGPLYSKQRIIQFANRVKVHPGIIVGQLHHRGEIGFSANREMLVKVRDVITETALTDGWGRMISPGIL